MRLGFDPWVRKISCRRKWQPAPIFLPGESHGREAWWATVYGAAVRHDRATNTITTTIRGQMCVDKVRKDLHKLLMRQAFLFWINAFIMNMYYLLKITLELFPLKIIVVNMSIIDESCSRERTLNFGLKVLFGVHSTIFSSWVSIWKTP